MLGFVFFMFRDFEDESARGAWKKPLKLLWWTFSVKWLNTDKSWFNKWKLGEDGTVQEYEPKWYHFGVAPKHKEAFPFSSTFLVGFTDGEHAFQKNQLNAIFGMFFIWNWMAGLSVIVGIYSFTFIKEKYLKSIS